MINFIIQDQLGQEIPIGIPDGIRLNLMEVLKAADLPVLATCGGMALCATCRVKVLEGSNQLQVPTDAEQEVLETLPFSPDTIRLSCQLQVDERMNNCRFMLVRD